MSEFGFNRIKIPTCKCDAYIDDVRDAQCLHEVCSRGMIKASDEKETRNDLSGHSAGNLASLYGVSTGSACLTPQILRQVSREREKIKKM